MPHDNWLMEVPTDDCLMEMPTDNCLMEMPTDNCLMEMPTDNCLMEMPNDIWLMEMPNDILNYILRPSHLLHENVKVHIYMETKFCLLFYMCVCETWSVM